MRKPSTRANPGEGPLVHYVRAGQIDPDHPRSDVEALCGLTVTLTVGMNGGPTCARCLAVFNGQAPPNRTHR